MAIQRRAYLKLASGVINVGGRHFTFDGCCDCVTVWVIVEEADEEVVDAEEEEDIMLVDEEGSGGGSETSRSAVRSMRSCSVTDS